MGLSNKNGRAALVTGGGMRIGRAITLALAGAGYDVAIHCLHRRPELDQLVTDIRAGGTRAIVLSADLRNEGELSRLVDDAAAELGNLDILVNNASCFFDDRFGALDGKLWTEHFAVNFRAPVLLAERFAQQAGEGSVIVNLIDQRVLKPSPQFFTYALSKAGLWHATRMMAQALAPKIRVVAVGPGPVLRSIHQTESEFEAEAREIPLERAIAPEEIASAVMFLVGATSVTGQMIAVDGGQHLAWRTPDIVAD
jgi:NAD(P)-dependent dehydrogenase (short-subunit alcohol dehydrogenase family)